MTFHMVEVRPWLEVPEPVRMTEKGLLYRRAVYKAVKYGTVVDGELETWYEYHHVPRRDHD